jgi:S-formylglutathione hydrolase FrmB
MQVGTLIAPLIQQCNMKHLLPKKFLPLLMVNTGTIKNRNARAITGLSMGGHGGLYLGFRHASDFGACGSMSGAFSLEHITAPPIWSFKIIGRYNK